MRETAFHKSQLRAIAAGWGVSLSELRLMIETIAAEDALATVEGSPASRVSTEYAPLALAPGQLDALLESERAISRAWSAAGVDPGREVDELTPAESELCELHGPMTAQEAKAHAKALESIICWYVDSAAIRLQPRHWPAVLAKREALGRPLEADDLRSIVDADRGLDGHD